MSCQHCTDFPNIAQEKSQASIKQKDKIVWRGCSSDIASSYFSVQVQAYYRIGQWGRVQNKRNLTLTLTLTLNLLLPSIVFHNNIVSL